MKLVPAELHNNLRNKYNKLESDLMNVYSSLTALSYQMSLDPSPKVQEYREKVQSIINSIPLEVTYLK